MDNNALYSPVLTGLRMDGKQEEIWGEMILKDKNIPTALSRAKGAIQRGKRGKSIESYQAAALYYLASQYNRSGAHLLEIGTYYGYSAAVMAQAAPQASLVTLNAMAWEVEDARLNLQQFSNVLALYGCSWDFLADYTGPELDFIFVDGDHNRVDRDFPWWNWLKAGGMMVFHDFSKEGPKPSPKSYQKINELAAWLNREPDVLVIDDQKTGMAGFIKRESDPEWSVVNG